MLPVFSTGLADVGRPGVVVVVDVQEAETLGVFDEIALTDAAAWLGNLDVEFSGEVDDAR